MRYTMMQVCKETGMTYQALKFYCNEGLVPNVKRDKNNRRVFDERDVAWISSLTCLKKCGMSIQEMKEYLELCLEGEETIPKRKEMLAKKQAALRASMQEFLDSQKTEMERYLPAEVDRINSAIFETYGTCVVLCVSSDTDTARSVIKEYVK